MKSSIIDVPRKHTQKDLFGIQIYQDALIRYIRLTDTPITIALQGEWGSGKTSLMNLLQYNLCEVDNAPYYPIWINTWQYSLMKTPTSRDGKRVSVRLDRFLRKWLWPEQKLP